MNAAFRAWRCRHAHAAVGHGSDRSASKLAWVFVGYATSVVAVSAVAYFAGESRESSYPWIMVVGSIPIAAVVWFLCRYYFESTFHHSGAIGVGVVRVSQRALARSALGGSVLALFATGLSLQFPVELQMDDSPLALMLSNGTALKVGWLMSAVFVAPLTEEILFRGVLLGSLSRRWGFAVASTASTAAFVTIHLPQVDGYVVAIVSIALLGFSAAIARRSSGSIWSAVALHASYNLVLAISGLALG